MPGNHETPVTQYRQPVTVERMTGDLARLGVKPGDIVLVHTAMSRIGWVCGGTQAAIDALRAAVGPHGTLVMPAHSMDVTDPAHWSHPPVPRDWQPIIRDAMPAYDPERTPTRDMGAIAEAFRRWPGTERSRHPAVSFSANGPDAKAILAHQPLEDPFGVPSPLSVLYDLNAKVLMIGTGYDTCTGLHLAERAAWGDRPPRQPDGAPLMTEHGRCWIDYTLPAHDTEHFDAIGAVLDREGLSRIGSVGYATTRLLSLRRITDRAKVLFPVRS